jgi:hypothetical protein
MKSTTVANFTNLRWAIISIAVIIFSITLSQLFFYDEDVFLLDASSAYMQQKWERSFLVKRFFQLQFYCFGKNAAGYHIVTTFLHVANALVGIKLLKKLLQYCNILIPNIEIILTAFLCIFLFTPIHSEPLSHILPQGVILLCLNAQLCVYFYLNSEIASKLNLLASAIFFIAALLIYEVSWTIPSLILCLRLYKGGITKQTAIKTMLPVALFFLLFAVWLVAKTTLLNRALVADYGDVTLKKLSFFVLSKNTVSLFIRNFIPPSVNTTFFVANSLLLMLFMAVVLLFAYKRKKSLNGLLILLLALTLIAYAPTILFGIDTHDAESERYVYFSSVFAAMFLVLSISSVVTSQKKIVTVFVIIIGVYCLVLFKTIKGNILAGQFSKIYVEKLNTISTGTSYVYLINQPTQFKGSLLFRALSRLPLKQADSCTVLNEYMHYLYSKKQTTYIATSTMKLTTVPNNLSIRSISIDSLPHYFKAIPSLPNTAAIKAGNSVVAALSNNQLLLFK